MVDRLGKKRVITDQETSFGLEVARGGLEGLSLVRVIARNTDVDTSQEEVWFQGGIESYLTSVEKMNVVSSSANDTSAGTGARTVLVEGLNGSYAETSETVTLNGISNVLTSNSYLRIHTVTVQTAGSNGAPFGAITLTAQTSSTVHANIPVGENRTGKSQYTIPAGKKGYLIDWMPSIAAGKVGADFVFQKRPLGGVFEMVSRLALQSTGTSAMNHMLQLAPPEFAEKTDLRVVAVGQANDQDVFCEYAILLIDN